MELQEDQSYILKGKRSKRQRPVSPFALTMGPTSSYSSSGGGGGYGDSGLTASPSFNSGEITTTQSNSSTVDEEDMANCLILLAKGRHSQSRKSSPESIKMAGGGGEVYQCKTCDRSFLSFQALGGHRASHKKPKVILTTSEDQKKTKLVFKDESTTLSLQIPSRDNKSNSRVHECSICGAEFNSGQALGGHMRRHRPMPPAATTSNNSQDDYYCKEVKKPRTLLTLDLNLPAPEDDHQAKFPFGSKEQVIVFSASPLVDCHY